MRIKGYLYCKCTHINEEKVEYCRVFAEKLFSEANYQIKRYTVTFLNEKQKSNTKTLLYTANKNGNFDTIQLNSCRVMIFRSPNPSAEVLDDQMCVYLTHKENDAYSVQITWTLEDYTEEEFLTKVNSFKSEIQQCFCIRYLFAGCMEPEKDADLFVLGMLKDSRTAFENKVARNIQRATYTDHRMPYLFPYTYIAGEDAAWNEGKIVIFRSLIFESIEKYNSSVEWNKCFDAMLEKDLIIPFNQYK